MKKVWVGLLLGSLLLAGCATSPKSSASKTSQKATSTKVAAKQAASQKNTASSDSSSQAEATLWNTGKEAALSTFMASWQREMGQTYVGTYDDKAPDHLGFRFPNALLNGSLAGRIKWGSQSVDLKWSKDGEDRSEFQVVAVATGGKVEAQYPNTYFFCLHHRRPVVFVTQTTNGDELIIHDTQNSALQAGFAKIITGSRPTTLTDSSLNVNMSRDAKANQWPQGYQGTWYYYNKYDHKINSMTQNDTDGLKLSYVAAEGQKWIHIMGAEQTAGAGNFEYVRYHYFDGRQIPVLMNASGAGAWFDNNAYPSAAAANQMRDWQYGDESKTSPAADSLD
ncbi:DUF4767 domain-containing protein [Lactiplantibacillus plantarum]|uniref:DUF4767 domain-containing protein n=1 Tax=Lactiplantibacillus plantarum TaxID=1590 RepID=UPI0028FC166B|nr:DUF4767 domain-containing protein [Lactiplantibacillus plantarum]WNW16519.1 DUF4767 domain-containing protein [Lactiplantibacillus plantarum]WNW19493.1 DUF4767 domain-containing protein [Lactiplantibacillus plantarum]